MTAYSFKARFVAPIQAGMKRQTIRAKGKRPHAQPGGLVQLYTGMRTKACRKIVDDVVCDSVVPVRIDLRDGGRSAMHDPVCISVDGVWLIGDAPEAFARADGFDSLDDMIRFWLAEHGDILFDGVCIRWRPAEEVSHGA